MAEQHFAVRLKRSANGVRPEHRAALVALGLTRFGRTVYIKDTPPNRGILYSVVHRIIIEPIPGPPPPSKRQLAKQQRGAKAKA